MNMGNLKDVNAHILNEKTHPIEKLLTDSRTLSILKFLTKQKKGDETLFEKIMRSYDNEGASLIDKIRFHPIHVLFDYFIDRKNINRELLKFKLFHHRPTLRALVNVAISVRKYGLTTPQKFFMPLMVVWNFTQACNLKCKHCYQNATSKPLPDEMTLEQKLKVIDEMGDEYVPFIAFAGGEPLMGRNFWDILKRCKERGIHTTVASNGTIITKEIAAKLVEYGVKYVEISIDSSIPEKHDEFRGIKGAWKRAMEGIRNAADTPGLRVGMATCISKLNYDEAEDIIKLAIDSGCSTFVHFNYIPVGRGVESKIADIGPEERENLLKLLNKYLQNGKISIMSTAPQLARACYMYAEMEGMMAVGHAGSAPGTKTRVLAKYIGGCGAARCYCAIEPNGDVTPCVYIPHRVLGNLKEKSLKEIWQNNIYFDTLSNRDNYEDNCKICNYRSICGGCRARADAYTGNIKAGDPGCIYNKELWERVKYKTEEVLDATEKIS